MIVGDLMTLFDYIDKYGDYTFYEKSINEVDNIIFSFLSYVNFHNIDFINYESLENVFSRGIMTGTDPTHFSPEMNLSRAMVATILYRMAGSPDVDTSVVPFPDIPKKPKAWYFAPIVWAKNVGVTNGYATGEFGRDDNISRQDFMKMLYSYALFKNLDVSVRDENSYLKAADGSAVSKYARTMVNWGYENGFIGNNSDLKPKDAITRAEAATIISRFINKYGL